jgi:thymidine kinase
VVKSTTDIIKSGKLRIITGPMFAGKTSLLIQKINEAKSLGIPFLILKPSIDNRYKKDSIVSHTGATEKSVLAEIDQEFSFEGYKEVFIDEIQFFTPKFIDSITNYLQKGVNFTLCGLEKDYLGNEFGSLPRLKEMSSEYILLEGDCELCNKPSTNTFRKTKNNNIIIVGSSDEYSSLCKTCYEIEIQKI